MEIEDIKKLTIESNERLLIKLPDTASQREIQGVRDAFHKLFPECGKERRILVYAGMEMQLEKVEIKDEQI